MDKVGSERKNNTQETGKEKKFDLYKQIKGNIKNQKNSCDDPISDQTHYCFDCHVTTCPSCTLDQHRTHNIICKYPYYSFDKKIVNEHFEEIDNIFKLNPEYINVDKVRGEMKIVIDSEIKGLISSLEKVKEDKMKEIDKMFNGSQGNIATLKKNVELAKKKILDFFAQEKNFFKINQTQGNQTSPFMVEGADKSEGNNQEIIIKNEKDGNNEEKEQEQGGEINNDYGNIAFLLNYDLLNTSSEKNKNIKATLSSIKDACTQYQDKFKQKIGEMKKQIALLNESSKETLNYSKLADNFYKEIGDKVQKYIEQIKTIQKHVYDTVGKTGQYEEIEKKNYMFELKQKQNIDNILNSQTKNSFPVETENSKEPLTTNPNEQNNKLRSSNKVRHFDSARRNYLSSITDSKNNNNPFNRPKVKLSSPNDVNLGTSAVQKYFTYLTMDLINKYFRPEKQKSLEICPIQDEIEEDIDIGHPIPGTNEMQIYDKKTRVTIKKKVPMDKAKLKYNYFLTGCRSVVIKDKIYITGGVDKERSQSKSAFVYHIKTNELQPMPDMIKPHAYHAIEYLEYYKSILVIGGENSSNCELYDMYSGQWRALPDLKYPRANPNIYLDKMTHMLYTFFGIVGNMSTASTFSDIIECLELRKADLGWGKVEYKNKSEMDFKFGFCRIFPLDPDRLVIYGASGVRDSRKKGAIFLLNKNEIVKVDNKMMNEMKLQAKKSKKLTKIISTFI